jgi:type IV pilus assembly protein PilY1
VVTNRTQLLQQVLLDTTASGRTVREIQRDPATGGPRTPDWALNPGDPSPPKDLGWYMDFPNSTSTGERSVFLPLLRGGRLIFTTVLPSNDPCLAGGSSFLMVIDPSSGGAFAGAVIDVNGDGKLNIDDRTSGSALAPVYASGLKSEIGITNTPRLVSRPPSTGVGSANPLGVNDPRTSGGNIRETYAIMGGSKAGGFTSPLLALGGQSPRVTWREVLRD